MKSIIALFWHICIFRAGPDTVPANNALMMAVILLNLVVNVAAQLVLPGQDTSVLQSVTVAVVSMAGVGGLVWFIMMLMDLGNRVPQTITALFGADILLTTIYAVAYYFAAGGEPTVATLILLPLIFWSLSVNGFIFHRSMDIHIGIGIAIALFVLLFSIAIIQTAIIQ